MNKNNEINSPSSHTGRTKKCIRNYKENFNFDIGILISTGTAEPPQERRSKLAGILILVFVIIFLIVGAVLAFIYRKQLMEKWRAFKQKAPGSKR